MTKKLPPNYTPPKRVSRCDGITGPQISRPQLADDPQLNGVLLELQDGILKDDDGNELGLGEELNDFEFDMPHIDGDEVQRTIAPTLPVDMQDAIKRGNSPYIPPEPTPEDAGRMHRPVNIRMSMSEPEEE